MFKEGPIPPFAHGVIEYAAALAFIAGPFILNFDKPSATTISIIIGLLIFAVAAWSDLPTGIVKTIPLGAHIALDLGLAALLLAAPFAFGFNEASKPTIFFLVFGFAHLLITFSTRFREAEKPEH